MIKYQNQTLQLSTRHQNTIRSGTIDRAYNYDGMSNNFF